MIVESWKVLGKGTQLRLVLLQQVHVQTHPVTLYKYRIILVCQTAHLQHYTITSPSVIVNTRFLLTGTKDIGLKANTI